MESLFVNFVSTTRVKKALVFNSNGASFFLCSRCFILNSSVFSFRGLYFGDICDGQNRNPSEAAVSVCD